MALPSSLRGRFRFNKTRGERGLHAGDHAPHDSRVITAGNQIEPTPPLPADLALAWVGGFRELSACPPPLPGEFGIDRSLIELLLEGLARPPPSVLGVI